MRGVSRTLLGWTFVGFTGISFKYALEFVYVQGTDIQIPGAVALLYQSMFIFLFPLLKCIFDDGISSLKVTEQGPFAFHHLSVSQRRYSIFIRSTLGVLAGASFEYSKAFSSIVDNSTMFGADALVVAIMMRFILKERLGKKWIWVITAFIGILTIFYTDFQSLEWRTSITGAFFGAFSTVCFAIVFLMTSYMVHHDKPVTIAFYQGVAALGYAALYFLGTLFYFYIAENQSSISTYFQFFQIQNLKSLPVFALALGGFVYGWALLLFFQSFYYTEVLILATLGYFLAPIISFFELLFYGESGVSWVNGWSVLLVSIGTAGLLWEERKEKKNDGLYIIPSEESPLLGLHATVLDYKSGRVDKTYYLSHMYEYDQILYSLSDLIKDSRMEEIKIKKNEVSFKISDPEIIIGDDASLRSPSFEIINFGDYEPEINFLLKAILKNEDTILDIGAGIGWHSLNIAKNFKNVRVYAFEPIRDLFEILSLNIKENGCGNIEAFNFGISDKSGKSLFHYVKNQHEYLGNILEPVNRECEVEDLKKLVDKLKIQKIDLIKQELKFQEKPFLIGNEKVVEKHLPMVILSFREYSDKELMNAFLREITFLESFGYERYRFANDLKHKESRDIHYFYFHPQKHNFVKNT